MGNKDNKEENKKYKSEVITYNFSNIQNYDDYQNCNLLWLDKEVNNDENKQYQDLVKKIKQIKLDVFTEIKDCIEKLKEIKFDKTFVLISGSLANNFLKEIEKNINEFYVLPVIMIFTSFRKTDIIKENIFNLNSQLFDINLIFTQFDDIKKQLKNKDLYSPQNIEKKEIKSEENFFFEYINKPENLIFPIYYRDYIAYPTKNEITEFNKFLLDNYYQLQSLIGQLLVKKEIPCEILLKYWLRAYTLNTNFYKEMNKCLIGNNGENYETYIKALYNGLQKQFIKPFVETKLYRGTRIKKTELDHIKQSFKNKKEGLPACICYSKAFLSTSIDEKIGLLFMTLERKTNMEEYVLYEIEKGNELDIDNQIASNTYLEELSFSPDEKETLFFPFSNFEIQKIKEEKTEKNEDYYRIYLSYLGKYKAKVDKTEKIPETQFTKIIMKTEVLDKFEMQKEPNKFTFIISDYISKEKKKNSIEAIYKITNNDINKKINILNHNDINKEEIKKRCDIYYDDKKIDFNFEFTFDKPGVHSFKFIFNDLLTNTSKLFYECKTLESLYFNKFKTDYITDMSNMFNGCCLLKSLDLSNFKTKRVTNMKQMFNNCVKLKNLDVSSFDTINVIDMSYMFNNCNSLKILNLSNFKTKSVKSMKGMFNNCNSLNYINISNFETTDVIDMSEMFNLCCSLNSLNLSKFNTYNVENMYKMFYRCSSLINLNLDNFKTPNLKNMQNMFSECSSLTSLNIYNFTTNNVENMNELFKDCPSLITLNLNNLDITKVNNMENMFINCNSLTTLYISKSFTIKNNIFEGLNKNCKINCDGKELNLNEILAINNSYNNSIIYNSICTLDKLREIGIINDNNFNNSNIESSIDIDMSVKSSVMSNFTNIMLDKNNIGKNVDSYI